MLKKTLFLISICLYTSTALSQMDTPYVRKRIQPNFFIPQGALADSKPEKVSLPQYRQGISTTKRISARDNQTEINTQLQQQEYPETTVQETEEPAKDILPEEPETIREVKTKENNTEETNDDTPNYQKMYQDYLKDLADIAHQGQTDTSQITKDLKQMGSDKRIKIDQNFNKHRNVSAEIEKALE